MGRHFPSYHYYWKCNLLARYMRYHEWLNANNDSIVRIEATRHSFSWVLHLGVKIIGKSLNELSTLLMHGEPYNIIFIFFTFMLWTLKSDERNRREPILRLLPGTAFSNQILWCHHRITYVVSRHPVQARHWYCNVNVIFVDCSFTRKLADSWHQFLNAMREYRSPDIQFSIPCSMEAFFYV